MDIQSNFRLRQIFFNILIGLTFILSTACGNNDASFLNNVSQTETIVQANDFQSNDTTEFLVLVSRQNVNLTKQDLILIRNLAMVHPSGEWTPGDEKNPTANLTEHFLKHGHDFKPPVKTPGEYVTSAIKAMENNRPENGLYLDLGQYKSEGFISLVKWNSITKEFVVWRINGQIASYFPANNLRPDRYIHIPDEMR